MAEQKVGGDPPALANPAARRPRQHMYDSYVQPAAQPVELRGERDIFSGAVGVEEHELACVAAICRGPQDAHARGDPDPVGDQSEAPRPRADAEGSVRAVDVETRAHGEPCGACAEAVVRTNGEGDPRRVFGA